jgi:cyclopropane-fatty-acyl-phospholipid synthase
MRKTSAQYVIQKLLDSLDIKINGDRPWDIRVINPDFYRRVLGGGSLSMGESYMDGWWRCHAIDQLFDKIMAARIDRTYPKKAGDFCVALGARFRNAQRRRKAYVIGERHYDMGNRLFSVMLDRRMNYSSGYWDQAETLEKAQEAKLDLICRKIHLESGMTVLDIGCGWGGFARWAAEKYGAVVLGITVSREQVRFARQYCQGLDIRLELKDYRDLNETFDRIVSIGMFEHVGRANYRTFMQVVHRCLNPEGLFLLHTIGGNRSVHSVDPWISKYIFPNSMLPSARQIAAATEGLWVLEDWHSFGHYYDPTLMAWHHNFKAGWDTIKDLYDERFFRMWTYYLLSCAGSFRSRRNQLWQILFSKNGIRGGCPSYRP